LKGENGALLADSHIILNRLLNVNRVSDFRQIEMHIDQIFCIRQILEKKWEYNETVHQLFVDFKKAYDSVRREIL
jgi:hypothetical protein